MHPHGPISAGLTPSQAEAAMHNGVTLVLASAGAGKTLTFTSAAALPITRYGIRDQHRAASRIHAQVEMGLEQQAGLRFTGDLGATKLLRQFWRKAALTKAGKQERRIDLLHRVILADGFAQGVALLRSDHLSYTCVGTSSVSYVSRHVVMSRCNLPS